MHIWIIAGVLLLSMLGVTLSMLGQSNAPKNTNNESSAMESVKFTINDIENISVHSGLDIVCPNMQGVSQNGYAYTVLLKGTDAVIERLGCGSGEPEIFAEAIAQDLERSGVFETLAVDQVLEKLVFRFYSPNETP